MRRYHSMNKSDSVAELSKAMAKFHQEVEQPMKDKDNPFFKSKYVPLENVVEAINNCAPKHGLAFTVGDKRCIRACRCSNLAHAREWRVYRVRSSIHER